jgi:lipoate-protein ligase A
MALDKYFSQICKSNSDCILRFYGWQPNCVSIGYHQRFDILNSEKLANFGYDIVRRPTGGRAIFHADELTYSIVVSRDRLHHRELYGFMHEIISAALQELNIGVSLEAGQNVIPQITHAANDFPCFTRSAETEVQFEGKKVVGSAQKIYRNCILQHGSILIGQEHLNILEFVNGDESDLKALQEEFSRKTITLKEISTDPLSPEHIVTRLLKQLELRHNISLYFKNLSKSELSSACAV